MRSSSPPWNASVASIRMLRRACPEVNPIVHTGAMSAERRVITVTESIHVARANLSIGLRLHAGLHPRTEWDAGITEATIIGQDPRTVRVGIRNLGTLTVVYRLDRRPERTSAVFEDVDSRWIDGGGGSWQYEAVAGGTRWQQTNCSS